MKVVGTFSGIGGLEIPFHRSDGYETVLLCDWWGPSQQVLDEHFGGVTIVGDIAELAETGLPRKAQLLTAGFPCTDLSQAGRTAGINGEQSGMVRHVFRILAENPQVETLVLENVRNMLVLDGGAAMTYLVDELETLGFRWAYRLVDSRFTGVPQRRHRVILVAMRGDGSDPRQVLFADDVAEPDHDEGPHLRHDAFGFYWTEGLRGLGWAVDAVPPLKGGSTVGIPSPPGIWIPGASLGRRIVTPAIEHAEALQGFPRGWTKPADTGGRNGPRWKLVGNAVTVGVTEWLVSRLDEPAEPSLDLDGPVITGKWPTAAWGARGARHEVKASTWPVQSPYQHLTDVCDPDECVPLTVRGATGFLDRLRRGNLNRPAEFERDVVEHIEYWSPALSSTPSRSA